MQYFACWPVHQGGIIEAFAKNERAIACTVLEEFTPVLRHVERLRFSWLCGRASVGQHAEIIDHCEVGDADTAAGASRRNWETLLPLLDTLPENTGHAFQP